MRIQAKTYISEFLYIWDLQLFKAQLEKRTGRDIVLYKLFDRCQFKVGAGVEVVG